MIKNKVKDILSKQFGIEQSTIVDTAHLVDDLGADSLDLLEIVLLIEQEFSIKIDQDEYVDANSVDKIVTLVATKL